MGDGKRLDAPAGVINIGLGAFAADLARLGVPVVDVDWSPPARGDARLATLVERLIADPAVTAANEGAVGRMLAADPWWTDVVPAAQAMPELGPGTILHAGPPIAWERMCGPLRGAIAGAIVYEGWAPDLAAAEALAAGGEIAFRPNHDAGAVGPMTGLITASMPVLVVENRRFGNLAYCTINEGLGKVMRFGGNDAEVLGRLGWIAEVLAPALAKALHAVGGIGLKGIVARGLAMGDEMHQRNVACSALALRALAPVLAETAERPAALAEVLRFIAGNEQFFLNLAMAMGKAIADPARGIAHASVVTAMARNGTDFGIRVSATGERWFTAPVAMPKGLYFPGFSEADANPDIGDSTIVETVGLGGFAMAGAPAVAGFVGAGSAADALAYTRAMYEITTARNPAWTMPALDFAGVPTGIDVRKVVESGVTPVINTGIAHREPGVGQVGAGIVRAPFACFAQAIEALAAEGAGT